MIAAIHRAAPGRGGAMLRAFQSLLVVVFFGVMMTLLVRDHVIPSLARGPGIEIDQRVLADSWVNQDEFFEVRLGEWVLGAMHFTAEEEPDPTTHYVIAFHVEINAFFRARIMSIARMSRRLELEFARVRIHLPAATQAPISGEALAAEELPRGVYEIATMVDGRTMKLRLRQEDAVKYHELTLDRPVTMTDSLAPILRGNMLSRGKTYTMPVYEPITGGSGAIEVTWIEDVYELIDGKASHLKKVSMKLGGLTTMLWVDSQGNVYRREIPLVMPSLSGEETASEARTKIVMQRLEAPDAMKRYPGVTFIPEMPTWSPADFAGEDRGDILGGLSVFSLLATRAREAQ
jgi:hypothetical protein